MNNKKLELEHVEIFIIPISGFLQVGCVDFVSDGLGGWILRSTMDLMGV